MAKTKKKKAKGASFDPLHIKGAFEDMRPQFMDNLHGLMHALGTGISDIAHAPNPMTEPFSPVNSRANVISPAGAETSSGGSGGGGGNKFDPSTALGIYDLSTINGGPQAIISYLQQTNPDALKDPTKFHQAVQGLGLQPAFMASKPQMPDPLTMAMVYQSTIQPFMNNILTDSRQQTDAYQQNMNQKLSSMNLAPNIRQFFQGEVPRQVASMNSTNDALAGSIAAQPGLDSLITGLQGIQKEQEKLAAGQQSASLGNIASLFGGKLPGT